MLFNVNDGVQKLSPVLWHFQCQPLKVNFFESYWWLTLTFFSVVKPNNLPFRWYFIKFWWLTGQWDNQIYILSKFGGWQARWLTPQVVFKASKKAFLHLFKYFFRTDFPGIRFKLYYLTKKGGWHFIKSVKKWLTG